VCERPGPNIQLTNCGVKISVMIVPTTSTVVITVMMMEKVFCASASRFSARNFV